MRLLSVSLLAVGLFWLAALGTAQPPMGGKGDKGGFGKGGSADPETAVTRMMTLDKNKDGKLTRDEVTDPRLMSLFDRADTNKDGTLTREELTAFFTKEAASMQQGGFGKGDKGGFDKGGFGKGDKGPPPFGKGGKDGPPPFGKDKDKGNNKDGGKDGPPPDKKN